MPSARATVLAIAAALAATGCQSPKGSCDTTADCAAGETCDSGVCVRLPPVLGNGSGGGVDPTAFTSVLWSKLPAAPVSVSAVGADPASGDVLVAGALEGAFDPWTLGTGGFAVRLGGAAGAFGWAVPFPALGTLRVAAAAGGDLFLAGTELDPAAPGSLFVGRLDALGPRWTGSFGPTSAASLVPVALAARGADLVVAGAGAADFGSGDTANASFVAALSGAGSPLWSRGLAGGIADLAARDSGEVAIAGLCAPAGAVFDPIGAATCGNGLFVEVLSSNGGATVWARRSTGTGSVTAVRSVAVAPDGSVAVVGDAKGSVAFGGASVDFGTAQGSFAAIFGPSGAPGLVIRPIEAPYAPLADAAAFSRAAYDRNGKLWLAGRYYGQPTLGGVRFTSCRPPACAAATFLARVEPNGSVGSFLPVAVAPLAGGAAWVDDLVLFATTGVVAHALQVTGQATVGGSAWPAATGGLGVLKIVP